MNIIANLRLLEEQLRLAPGKPSERQCAAGARAGNVSAETARTIYEAMIEANERTRD